MNGLPTTNIFSFDVNVLLGFAVCALRIVLLKWESSFSVLVIFMYIAQPNLRE